MRKVESTECEFGCETTSSKEEEDGEQDVVGLSAEDPDSYGVELRSRKGGRKEGGGWERSVEAPCERKVEDERFE